MESRKIFAILEILLSILGKMFHSSPIITLCLYVNGVSYHSWFIRKDEFMEALGARGEIKKRLVKYD